MGLRFRRLISAATFVRLATSILLAMIIWGFIVWETNPEITRQFPNIAITAENVPVNMQIIGGLPSATVTIKGPEDVVEDIVPSNITASIDFSIVEGPGINEFKVDVNAPSGVRKVIVEPSTIEVELDLIVTRTLPISLFEAETRPASITSIDASTEVASIQGPQDLVDQVDAVILPVDLQSRRESFSESVALVPVDVNGNPVIGVEVSPATVELSVTFESTSRDVPIIVKCACIVDERLEEIELTAAAAIPSTVRLSGPSSAFANIIEVETVPIDISQLEESGWILDVELDTRNIPDSVILSNATVDVWVPIAPSQLELQDVEIQAVGLGDGLRAEIDPESVFVVVTGSRDLLDDPNSLHVVAIVDLSDLSAGSYTIDVEVAVPPGVTYENVTPESATVVISPVNSTANRLQEFFYDSTSGVR